MHLVLDVGNTNIKWALFDNNMLTDYQLIKDLSYDALKAIILKYQKINTLCVSNNTNRLNFIAKICEELSIKYIELSSSSKLPIEIVYNSIETLGVDRIALAVGSTQYQGNKLVIDFGTCITYDLVIGNTYMGGQISPGLGVRLSSLHDYTQKLPKLELKEMQHFIGDTTDKSMLIGVVDSVLFETEKVIQKYKNRYPSIVVVGTGGDVEFISERIKNINFIRPYLLMEGLNYIIAFNEKI